MKVAQILSTCVVLSLGLAFIGCAPKQMYYWGDYSDTLYKLEKEQSEEALLSHMKSLEKIIEISQEKNARVPPGVYAELGYLYMKNPKKAKEGIKFFEEEKKLYPESTVLMDRLIQSAERRDKSQES